MEKEMEAFEELQDEPRFERETRDNGSQVFTEPYNEGALSSLKHLILAFYEQGKRKYYSILVDGETVVPKTSDGRKFDNHLRFVNDYTKMVEVRLYQGYSFNCNKHQFIINRGLAGLTGGASEQDRINKAIEAHKKALEYEAVEAELKANRKKLKKLKKQKKASGDSGFSLGKLKEIVSGAVGIVGQIQAVRNGGVAGIPQTTPAEESEVEIEREDESTDEGLSKKEHKKVKKAQKLFYQLLDEVGIDGILETIQIMNGLSEYPELNLRYLKEMNQLKKNRKNGEA